MKLWYVTVTREADAYVHAETEVEAETAAATIIDDIFQDDEVSVVEVKAASRSHPGVPTDDTVYVKQGRHWGGGITVRDAFAALQAEAAERLAAAQQIDLDECIAAAKTKKEGQG